MARIKTTNGSVMALRLHSLSRTLIAVLLVCMRTAITPASTTEMIELHENLPWKPHFGQGVWQVNGKVSLTPIFTLAADQQHLVIDAATASAVTYHQTGGARNGIAVGPEQVEIFIDAAGSETAKITIWYRLRRTSAPDKARFLQGIDASLGAPVGWVTVAAPAGEWVWLRSEQQLELRPHRHELQLAAIPPGIELGQVVISRDHQWEPPDRDPLPNAAVGVIPRQGKVVTDDVVYAEVSAWLRLSTKSLEMRGGSVNLQVSSDHGKSWQSVADDGSLAAVKANGDGRDRIRVRATLSRNKDGQSPLLGTPIIAYRTPANATFSVEAGKARWIFARQTGALCGIVNIETGTALAPLNRPSPLFEMRLKPPGYCADDAWVSLDSLDAVCLESGVRECPASGFVRQLRFRYRIEREDGSLNVILRAAFTNKGEAHWSSEVTNNLSALEVAEFAWPILNNIKTTDKPATDKVLLGGCYLFDGPSRVGRFFYSLPGTLLMPMLDLSGANEGITLAGHDPSYRNVMMSCAGQREAGVRLSLHRVMALGPGRTYAGAPNVVRVHSGDWRTACLLESPHAQKLYPAPPDMLPSIEQMDGVEMHGWPVPRWDRFGNFAENRKENEGFMHLGLWNFQVPKTYWNTPHPNPIMGNAEDLKWAIREFRKSGMRITFYIQSVLTSPMYEGIETDDYVGYVSANHLWSDWRLPPEGWTERHRSRKANGDPNIYGHTPGLNVNLPMAHGSQGFHDYKWEWAVERFGRQIGLDGIYWDSNSNASPSWGTNDRYDNDPGLSAVALRDTQQAINQAYAEMRPGGFWTWGEGSPNAFMNAVRHVHLANAYTLYPIRILFPQMVLVPSGANGQDPEMHKAFLAGARLYGSRHGHGELQKAMIRIRRKVKQYLYPANYRHDLDLKVSDDRIQATLSLCDPERTRGAVLNILNLEQVQDATITVNTSLFGPVKYAWLIDSDGQEIQLPVSAETHLTLPLSTAKAAHMLLFNRAEPRVTATVDDELAAGNTVAVKITVESLTGERQQGIVRLQTADGLHAEPLAFDTTNRQILEIQLKADFDAVSDIFDIPVTVRLGAPRSWPLRLLGAKRNGAALAQVITLYVHEPVFWALEQTGPEKARLRLQNRTTQSVTVRAQLKAGKGSVELAEGTQTARFTLAPGEQTEWSVNLRGAAEALRPWRLRGHLQCDFAGVQQEIVVYRQFWPLIPNGSLELCDFRPDPPAKEYYEYARGDDKLVQFMANIPDYWWGMQSDRSPQITHHEGLSLDEVTPAADGKRSLKLTPGNRARTNLVVALKAGTRYHLTAALRSSKPGPKCNFQFGNVRLALTNEHEPERWHILSTEFVAQQDGGSLYLFTGEDATTWFDDFNAVPLSAPGEADTDN